MPQLAADKSHSELLVQLLHWGMVLCATVVVFLPLFLIKVFPAGARREEGSAPKRNHLVFLPSSEQPNLSPAIANIYAWLDLRDPFLILKPNRPNGFQPNEPHLQPRNFHALPQVPAERPFDKDAEPPVAGKPPVFDDQPLRRAIREQRDPRMTIIMPSLPERKPPVGIFWKDTAGRSLEQPPEIDLMLVLKMVETQRPEKETCLELDEHFSIPRILVRESCGIPDLDRMAVEALREFARKRQKKRLLASEPLPERQILKVCWRLP
ncbi:MAG: hypothetical protein IJJ26_12525 [Victivallales bacterium]|nr:hypothetical protein [Victivallales bacterium]